MPLRRLSIAVLALSATTLGGCIGALVALPPLGASVLIGTKVMEQRARKRTAREIEEAKAAVPAGVIVTDMTTLPPPSEGPSPLEQTGQIEQMVTYVSAKLAARKAAMTEGPDKSSVVLMPGATLSKPEYTLCDTLPPALLIDLDTATGATVPVSEALADALDRLREQGVKAIFMSGTAPKYANMIATDLMVAGLGNARREDTFWLVGDRGSSGKDGLMWKIASNACVIAIAGGERGDFTPLLDMTDAAAEPGLIGAGWFLLPQLGTGAVPLPTP